MSAILKFLKLLLLGTLALVLAGAVIGVGYWQFTRQAELLDGFEYIAWNSDYQRQIDTVEDGEGREFKVMKLARRYSDHWIGAFLYPDDYVSDDGESMARHLGIAFLWDADCVEGTEIDTGVPLGDGTADLKCIDDGDKLRFFVTYGDPDKDPWSDMPDFIFELGGYSADTGLVQYLPWEEARRFHTLQKATKASESD